jgi:hypothetical protein
LSAESSLDFDAYWRAWLAMRLAEMRQNAEGAHPQQEENQGEQEE